MYVYVIHGKSNKEKRVLVWAFSLMLPTNVLPDSCGKVLEFKCFVKYRLPIVDQLD